ncbi:MAG TPA: DUF4388 domain-containing protein [Anaeromyxobacteraceae bacterium]|nr:DUF4388 domain-containing protein [Anaeromyxobacteraceae bacterium]
MALAMAIMQGDLAEYALPDLLQFIHATRKEGQLLLEAAPARAAGVYFAGGEVVHAYCPPRVGLPAFYALLGWEQGRFAFLKNAAPFERTIFDGLQNLLLDGLRRLDELKVVRARLPARDAVLHLAPESERAAEIRLQLPEWRVLSSVNGRRTLEEVLQLAGGAEDEASRIVYGLLVAGLVTTARDDSWLEAIVAVRIPSAEAPAGRAPPPTLLANLILKRLDGRASLAAVARELGCGERALGEELHLLVRTGWARVTAGQDLYQRFLAG